MLRLDRIYCWTTFCSILKTNEVQNILFQSQFIIGDISKNSVYLELLWVIVLLIIQPRRMASYRHMSSFGVWAVEAQLLAKPESTSSLWAPGKSRRTATTLPRRVRPHTELTCYPQEDLIKGQYGGFFLTPNKTITARVQLSETWCFQLSYSMF